MIESSYMGSQKMSITGFGGSLTSTTVRRISCQPLELNAPLNVLSIKKLGISPNRFSVNCSDINFQPEDIVCDQNIPVVGIIGNDNFFKVTTGVIRKLSNNLGAIHTVSGWLIYGTREIINSKNKGQTEKSKLKSHFEQNSSDFNNGKILIDTFENCLERKDNGRYVVHFPWKDNFHFRSSYLEEARSRLFSVVRNLVRKGQLKQYDDIIKSYLKDDIAEETSEWSGSRRVRYLPHHGVLKENSETTKLRIVLDASAKSSIADFSLNDSMKSCQNLLPTLVSVLLRFRQWPFALSGDVRKAFLQIEVHPDDRDSLRFLWFRETLSDKFPSCTPTSFRMKRLPFGLSVSPFILCATIRSHLQRNSTKFPSTVQKVIDNIYMDDLVVSTPTMENAIELKNNCVEIFNEMKMELTKWQDNFSIRNQSVNLFGLLWNSDSDTLNLSIDLDSFSPRTKRELTGFICAFWDPLGLFSPFLIRFKCALAELWKRKIKWDSDLPVDISREINSNKSTTTKFSDVKIPRHVCNLGCKYSLCVFTDASQIAFGAAVYMYNLDETNSSVRSSLLISKSRVASKGKLTIAKLELCAALLGARLLDSVQSQIKEISQIRAYSDSQIVIHWIRNVEKKWPLYIENRVNKIRFLIPPGFWQYIRSEMNPADRLTRGMTLDSFRNDSLWWEGPCLDNVEEEEFNVEYCQGEDKKALNAQLIKYEPIIDLSRFSNWNRCCRALAYAQRFINQTRKKGQVSRPLSNEELDLAETRIVKQTQQDEFQEEIEGLIRGEKISKASKIYALNPFLDEIGILRVNTRLDNSAMSYSEKFPSIIPAKSTLARLLIHHAHRKLLHAGVSTVISELRRKFWIIHSRREVKSCIKTCALCKRRNSKPVRERWAPLPAERVDSGPIRPFDSVGIDYVGPLQCQSKKCYIVLFTCLRVRAIHLELVESLESKEFISAFHRFVARRGIPSCLFTDNAKTFKGSETDIINEFRLRWNYITERSPHKGGAWERLVRSVKSPLRMVLRQANLSVKEMTTILCKIEALINKRPLCYVCQEPDERIVLTPEDFLIPKLYFPDSNLVNRDLGQILKRRDTLLKSLFTRWKKEFLQQKCVTGVSNNEDRLCVGDIVLIDNDQRREYWPLGKILELFYGRDGVVRSVRLWMKGKEMRRGINRLYLLERGGSVGN